MTTKIGSTVLRFDRLASTNDYARELAAGGADEGVTALAYEQTAGRGRHGRQWSSPAGEGLYFSVILRPEIDPARAPVITLAAAVAVAETLAIDFKIKPDIKWPNDVLVRGKKICGILVESAIEQGRIQYLVMGIGVNLAQREFVEEIRDTATSLVIESGQLVTPDNFLAPLLDRLERWYRIAIARPREIIAQWESLSSYARDCAVRIESADGIIEGVTRGLTPTGSLIIELESGERREVVSGEIKLRKFEVPSPKSEIDRTSSAS
ncbi:MAG TPA: biotin--[acetyl-CoA-carboxylase] ligase [Blastocatellia bacterium]|nr:biotin--[acetyl-CoA-carboxylase] ligase [Blastocatellia bacterium]